MSRVSTSSIDRAVSMTNSILFRAEVGQPEDVPAMPFHDLFPLPCGSSFKRTDHSSGVPSTRTSTVSVRDVGTFRPTKSARMGSSR